MYDLEEINGNKESQNHKNDIKMMLLDSYLFPNVDIEVFN
jgi:hypothetical protein